MPLSWFTSAVASLLTADFDPTSPPRLPPELLDRVIDLEDDRQALLSLGLVCKQTLAKSRARLFSTTFIDGNDNKFDTFLRLLSKPWTSFAVAVEILHLKDLFHAPRGYKYGSYSIESILAQLPNLRALWLTNVEWLVIPSQIREILFHLPFQDIQLDHVLFSRRKELVEFFSVFPPNYSGYMSFYDIIYDEIADVRERPAVLQRPLRIKLLDSSSIIYLRDVLSRAIESHLGVSVSSLHLRLRSFPSLAPDHYQSIAAVLYHVGSSLDRLFIELYLPGFGDSVTHIYDSFDFSQCTSLRMIHIGHIKLPDITRNSNTESNALQATMWRILATISPHAVEEVVISFVPNGESPKERELQLQRFNWTELVSRLQDSFRRLNKLTIRLGGVYFIRETPEFATCIDIIRQCGLKRLENDGVIHFDMVPLSSSADFSFEPPWRQASDSNA